MNDHSFAFGDSYASVSEFFPSEKPDQLPALVFIHGRLEDSSFWDASVAELSDQFQCICPDLPGFGRSFCPSSRGLLLIEHVQFICCVLDYFKTVASSANKTLPPQMILVGHDLGGIIAQLCSVLMPEKITAMILVDSLSFSQSQKDINTGIFDLKIKRHFFETIRSSKLLTEEQKTLLTIPWVTSFAKVERLRALRTIEHSWPGEHQRKELRSRLKALSLPTLILHGKQNSINTMEHNTELSSLISNSEFLQDEQSGFWIGLENPKWLSSRILEFSLRFRAKPLGKPATLDQPVLDQAVPNQPILIGQKSLSR